MTRFAVLILAFSVVTSQKHFGPFSVQPGNIDHPEPENDVAHYHFRLTSKGRGKKQVSAKIEFLRKVEDLKISGALFKKKSDTQAGEYYQTYQRTTPKSLCTSSFPFLKKSFTGTFNEEDCSLEKGLYEINDWALEDELRKKVGESSFYGDFKGILYISEGPDELDIIVVEITFSVIPADEGTSGGSNKKQKFLSKKKS